MESGSSGSGSCRSEVKLSADQSRLSALLIDHLIDLGCQTVVCSTQRHNREETCQMFILQGLIVEAAADLHSVFVIN